MKKRIVMIEADGQICVPEDAKLVYQHVHIKEDGYFRTTRFLFFYEVTSEA